MKLFANILAAASVLNFVNAADVLGLRMTSHSSTSSVDNKIVGLMNEKDRNYQVFLMDQQTSDLYGGFTTFRIDQDSGSVFTNTIYDAPVQYYMQYNPSTHGVEFLNADQNVPLTGKIENGLLSLNGTTDLHAVVNQKHEASGFTDGLYVLAYYPDGDAPSNAVKVQIEGQTFNVVN